MNSLTTDSTGWEQISPYTSFDVPLLLGESSFSFCFRLAQKSTQSTHLKDLLEICCNLLESRSIDSAILDSIAFGSVLAYTLFSRKIFFPLITSILKDDFEIQVDEEAIELIKTLDSIYISKLMISLSEICKSINNHKILTTVRDDKETKLLLIVCFDSEKSYEDVDQTMEYVYEILRKNKARYLTAVESFSCLHSNGRNL